MHSETERGRRINVEYEVEQNRYAVVALPGNPFFIAV
jgi:hypothetical protein